MLPASPTATFPYQIQERVGVGSMGVVYRATEPALDRAVAVKTLRPNLLEEEPPEVGREMRRRFLQEARAAARLSHPGVTVVHRADEEAGLPYLVMEWLEGRSLDAVLGADGPFDPPCAARLTVALLEALGAAHAAGVVHRDVKPSNLMLLDDGRLKVTDFGIARIQGQDLVKTQAGVVLATPRFASPEQLRGQDVDGRADLFAVGVLLFHLVSGRYPFRGDSFMELANAILTREAPPLRQVVPDVPAELESVVAVALRKDRGDRFPDAESMASRLRPLGLDGAAATVAAGPFAEGDPAADTRTARLSPVLRDAPPDPALALVQLVRTWPATPLPRQDTRGLVARLLERPLHAPAFAGAALLGHVCLLFADGVLLAAVDSRTGDTGDAVEETLPEEAAPALHPLPAAFPPGLVAVLAGVVHPPEVLHADLDSTFINLPALADKLRRDRFDGIFRLRRGEAWGLAFFVDGEVVLSLYSEGWHRVPVEQSWRHWISEHPVRAQVEARCATPTAGWFRHALRDFELAVEPAGDGGDGGDGGSGTGSRLRKLLGSTRAGRAAGDLSLRVAPVSRPPSFDDCGPSWDRAPAARFLAWAVGELPGWLAERDLFGRFKYLAEWLLDVRRATLYHQLERPGSRDADAFDLVTRDADGKVLHLAQHLARPTVEGFRAVYARAVAAKLARRKSGDVGGVFLVAPDFAPEVLHAYEEVLTTASSGNWFGVEESFTGYAGFVRLGPRRGFHLLLVRRTEDGFEPVMSS